jgi:glycosyltransferase involved in cell wall biosynthesis
LLGLLRQRHPEVAFVSRAHGFDLYEHQHSSGVIPFRAFQLQQVDRVFCVSQAGLDHMLARHPAWSSKYELARLGTRDHGVARPGSDGTLSVASCAFFVPRKRIHLIVEALALTKVPVRWTHFGGGPEMDRIRALVATLPPHIQVDLKGAASNSAIMQWYASEQVDVFLHSSHLEGGVAVALQEAASFGIPLIAADSGGVRDIVTPETGILLPTAMDPAHLASILDGFRAGPMATAQFRAGVRRFWERNFKAEVTFDAFCDRLVELQLERRQRSSRPPST